MRGSPVPTVLCSEATSHMATQWGPCSEAGLVSPTGPPRPSSTGPCPVFFRSSRPPVTAGTLPLVPRVPQPSTAYVRRALRPAQAVRQAEGPVQVRRLLLRGPPKAGSHDGPPTALAAGGHLRGHLGWRWVPTRLRASRGLLGAGGPSLRFPPPEIVTSLPFPTSKSRSLKTQKYRGGSPRHCGSLGLWLRARGLWAVREAWAWEQVGVSQHAGVPGMP